MSSLRLVFIVLLVVCPCRLLRNVVSSASSLTLPLNSAVTLDLVALPGSATLWMGRTPVTMRQFRAFVKDSGYRTDAESPPGQGPGHVGGHGWDAQRHRFDGWWQYTWRHTGWPLTDEHPVSNISWNDASAFCNWLSEKSGRQVRLATDAEWERRHARARRRSISLAIRRQVLKVVRTSQTGRCCEVWEIASTLREDFPSTMATRSPFRLGSSNRIRGDCTI